MSDLGNKVTQLTSEIKELDAQIKAKKEELKGLTGSLRDQLREVQSLTGQRLVVHTGRPRGTLAPGELTVTQQVVNYLATCENGATRKEILDNVPPVGQERRESAVQAAIRQHQLAGRVRNDGNHRWFYVPGSENTEPVLEVSGETEIVVPTVE